MARISKQQKITRIRSWIKALRSDKYKQTTTGTLKHKNRFDPLGVACVIAGIDFSPQASTLPEEARKHYGFNSSDPYIYVPYETVNVINKRLVKEHKTKIKVNTKGKGLFKSIGELNDVYSLNFRELADCIQATYIDKK